MENDEQTLDPFGLLNISNDINWDTLLPLDGDNLIHKLMACHSLTKESSVHFVCWMDSFLESNGVQHLIHLLKHCDIQNDSLMSALFPLLNVFLMDVISVSIVTETHDALDLILIVLPNNDAFVEEFNQFMQKRSGMDHTESGESPWSSSSDIEEKDQDGLEPHHMKEHASSIMESVDCRQLFLKSLQVFQHNHTTSKLLTHESTNLCLSLLCYKPELWVHFMDFMQSTSLFSNCMQSRDDVFLECTSCVFRFCEAAQSPHFQKQLSSDEVIQYFFKQLLQELPTKCDSQPNLSILFAYFELLGSLLYTYTARYNHSVNEFPQLFEYIIDQTKHYISKNTFDDVLCSLLNTLSVLIKANKPYAQHLVQSGFVDELWDQFLFYDTVPNITDNWIDGLSKRKRCAFRLILYCTLQFPETHSMIMQKVNTFQSLFSSRKQQFSGYNPSRLLKSTLTTHTFAYVGLENIGATSWMNCILQQLYMIPDFRYNLISAAIEAKSPNKTVLTQLTRLFACLSSSIKHSVNTMDFCRSITDETGCPMDDVCEFFHFLSEKVSAELHDTKYDNLWSNSFGTEVSTRMICLGGCNNIRESKKERRMMVTVPVKDKINLVESLHSFVSAHHVHDVQCDICDRKCATLLQETFSSLPNTIFFRLQRFTFNEASDVLQTQKLYDRFEFPLTIDLKPFTQMGDAECDAKTDAEYYEYELYGVIVHMSNEEDDASGICYSYIRDRYSNEWIEFNDTLITAFDIHDLPQETFGGVDWQGDNIPGSAYILVYQRKQQPTPQTPRIAERAPELHREIFEDNMALIRDIQLYNVPYFEFIYYMLCIRQKECDVSTLQIATLTCIQYVRHNQPDWASLQTLNDPIAKRSLFRKFIAYLKHLYEGNMVICRWFLEYLSKEESSLDYYVLRARDSATRQCIRDLIVHCLRETKDAFVFMDRMVELISMAPKHWFRFQEFFNIFYEYSCIGHVQRNYLIDKGLIHILGDFYLGKQSPYAMPEKAYPQMGSRMYPTDFEIVIRIICKLLCACHTSYTENQFYFNQMDLDEFATTALVYKDEMNRDCLYHLSEEDEKLPSSEMFNYKIIANAHDKPLILDALNQLIIHWSFGNKTYSENMIKTIAEGVDKSGADQVKTYLCMMDEFIRIEDELQEYRLEYLFAPPEDRGVLYYIECYQVHHQPFTYVCMKYMLQMMKEYRPYLIFMIAKRDEWRFWDDWMIQWCERQTDTGDMWYQQEYIAFFVKYYQLLVHGCVNDMVKKIDFEKDIPIDIIPVFAQFFW
eukprot:947972_1